MRAVLVILRLLLWIVIPLWRSLRGHSRAPLDGFASVWMLALVLAVLLGVVTLGGGLWAAPFFVAALVGVMPWTVARRVLVPLGMSRAARVVASLSGWTWGADRQGGGLVAAVWAELRKREPDRDRLAAIEAARDAAATFSGARVLATGLVAAARGDMAGARTLLESVASISPRTTPPAVQALAREWLVAEAAEQGEWPRAARLARGPGSRTRATRLLGAIAARLAGEPGAPSPASLWALWLIAPARRHTLAWVRRAIAARPAQAPAPVPLDHRLETSLPDDAYDIALSTHVAILGTRAERLRPDDLERLGTAWDRALADGGVRALVMQRAALLGAKGGERALASVADAVARDLAGMARAAKVPLGRSVSDSRVLGGAQRWLREELFGELELAFDALSARASSGRALPAIDEWREWLSLRAIYDRACALGGMELRRLAFPHVHQALCKHAVWLWNERTLHLMANTMFRWLLDEALAVGDVEAIELQSRNYDASL